MDDSFPISFHAEDVQIDLSVTPNWINWISDCIESEGKKLESLNFIFCSDEYLYNINLKYLNHDYYTDVITFPYSDEKIEGDIFISLDRVNDNARKLNLAPKVELRRVIIHGVLHLIGFNDKSESLAKIMRAKEDEYLDRYLLRFSK